MTSFGDELRRLMGERGISTRRLAREVPCDPGYVSKLATGTKCPSAQLAARFDELLGAGGALAALLVQPRGELDGGSLELIELARRADISDLGSGTIDLLQGTVEGLCREYPVSDAATLAARIRQHLRYVTGLLGKRVTLPQHRELLVLAGWLAVLLACTLYDAGDAPAARTARQMAAQFGEQAGHGEITAWALETAAYFALVEHRFADTVALSEAGLEHAGTTSAAVQLALQAARGYARMGDSRARGALAEGQRILDRLPDPAHPDHHFAFDRSKYEFYVATVLTWLGTDDAAAGEHARWVITQCRSGDGIRWPMRLAMSELDLALIASRRGDLDQAVTLGASALSHRRRSAQLLPRAAELGRDLDGRYPGERLVTGYREQLAITAG